MITNQRQYTVTRAQAKKFAEAIKVAEQETPAGIHPQLHQAMIDGLRSQLEELSDDLQAYDALRSGQVRKRTISSLAELPTVLIEGRIAKQMTQKRLAEKLDLPEQQIQRYEANRYAGASLERLQQIATAIGLRLRKTIDFDLPTPALASGAGGGSATSSRRRTAAKRATAKPASARQTTKRAAAAGGKQAKTTATAKRASAKKAAAASKKTTAKQTTAKKNTASSKATKGGANAARRSGSSRTPSARSSRPPRLLLQVAVRHRHRQPCRGSRSTPARGLAAPASAT